MTASPEKLIEAYVLDVVRRLPLRLRNDVGVELRSLLGEELRGRAGDEGRLPDEAMALDLVRGFGAPDDVAARYHAPGVAIIPPAQTTGFAWASLIGIALQWAATLPPVLAGGGNQVGAWWLTFGLGAFWWPGFMVMMALAAALVRQRWPAREAWRPPARAGDAINRGLYGLGLAAALAGVGIWVAVAWAQATMTGPLAQVFRFAGDFLALRAPLLLLYWAAGIVLLIVVIAEGRWRTLTRRLDVGVILAGVALMLWFALDGPIFVSEATDRPVKAALLVIAAVMLGSLGWKAWRGRSQLNLPRVAPPAA